MTADKIKARILVIIQLGCIIFIFASGSPVAHQPLLLLLQIAGMAIGIWAIIAMGIGNMNISPLVKQGAVLVTRGPYRLIRHPMYLAVLLVIWPLIIDRLFPAAHYRRVCSHRRLNNKDAIRREPSEETICRI